MKRGLYIALCILMTTLAEPRPAAASVINGAELLGRCQSEQHFEQGQCLGFIVAVMDVLSEGGVIRGLRACVPATAPQYEITHLVRRFMVEQLDMRRDYSASYVVAFALAGGYPC